MNQLACDSSSCNFESYLLLLKVLVHSGETQRGLKIVIEGDVGSGKSWALRNLAYRLARAHLVYQVAAVPTETTASADAENTDETVENEVKEEASANMKKYDAGTSSVRYAEFRMHTHWSCQLFGETETVLILMYWRN